MPITKAGFVAVSSSIALPAGPIPQAERCVDDVLVDGALEAESVEDPAGGGVLDRRRGGHGPDSVRCSEFKGSTTKASAKSADGGISVITSIRTPSGPATMKCR